MDDRRFDDLARALAGPASRRAGLRALAGAALAGVLGAFGVEEVAARCFGQGRPC